MSSVALWIVRLGAWGGVASALVAKNLIYSLLGDTTIGKICMSFLQIGGSESD